MQRYIFLILFCLLIAANISAQTNAFHENFEPPSFADSVTSSQTVPGTDDWALSHILSYGGQYSDSCSVLPVATSYLTTDTFSTLGKFVVHLDFNQICKIDFLDIAKLEISVDSGATWTILSDNEYLGSALNFGPIGNRFTSSSYGNDWFPGDNSAIPDNNWWKHEKFDISALASDEPSVLIRFVLQDGGVLGSNGNYGWLVDDIIVRASVSELDPPVIELVPPVLSGTIYNLGPFQLKAKITDSSGIETAFVVYNVNWGINDTTAMSIWNADTFTATIPAVNHKDTVCYHVVAIDSSASHNVGKEPQSGCLQFTASSGITFPYIDNFDVQNLWTANSSSTGTDWEIGTPNYGQTNTAHSLPYSWDINLNSPYSLNANATLWSPVFNFTNAVNATLSFWQNRNTQLNYDGTRLEYTTDGIIWQVLGIQNDPLGVNWYNSNITAIPSPAWTGNSNGWKKSEYDLGFLNYASGPVQFRFIFTSNAGTQYDGMSIDDFSITLPPLQEAHMISILKPESGCNIGLDTVSIEICNGGLDTINGGLSASYYLLGGTATVTESVTDIIPPGDTILFNFQTLADLTVTTADSIFELIAYVDLIGDPINYNDTLSSKILSGYSPPDPIVTNITIAYGTSATLTPVSNDSLYWFDVPAGGVEIATGPSFITPVLYDTTVYYVQAGGTGLSSGDSLITTYAAGNGHRGVMFDITATNTITITSFDVNLNSNTFPKMEIYYKYGSYVGFGTDPSAWTLLGSHDVVNNAGAGNGTPLPIGGLTINAGDTYGIYVTSANATISINYSNIPPALTTYTDINIVVNGGLAGEYPFNCTISNRMFNGTIHYSLGTGGGGCPSNRIADTVFVGGAPPYDASVVSILTPVSDFNLSAAEQVKVKLKNYGTMPISGFALSYTVNGGTPQTDTVFNIVNPGDTLIHLFSSTANLFAFGLYDFQAYVNVNGDLNQLNDTAYAIVENMQHIYCPSNATSTLYSDIGNVTISNLNNGIASPIFTNPNAINQYTDYTYMQPVQLTIGNTYQASISQIFSSATFYASYVKIYVDLNIDGTFDETTEELFAELTSNPGTTVTANITIPANAVAGISTMRVVMEQTTVASNVHPCGTYSYGETEDYTVIIAPPIPFDAGVIQIIQPQAIETQGDIVPVEVVVKNFGTSTITYMSIAYDLNYGVPVYQQYFGPLAPGLTDTVILSTLFIPALDNLICAYTFLAGDSNAFNNHTCKNFYGDPRFNAEAVSISSPAPGCGLGAETVTLRIHNTGIYNINGSLNASYYLLGGSGTVTEAVNTPIAPGDTLDYSFLTPVDLAVTSTDSTFEIIAYVELQNDPILNNDTTTYSVLSSHVPPDPIVTNANIPFGNNTTLHAISNDSIFWFDVPAGGIEIATGPYYTTPILYGNTVYWVEARSGMPEIKITEICQFTTGQGATNPYPPDVVANWDGLEITNVGSAPADLAGYTVHLEGGTTVDYTILNGVTLNAGEVLLLTFYGNGAVNNPANNFYVMSTTNSTGSASMVGYYIQDPAGLIVDAVATNSYLFSNGTSGVTPADWSGNIASSSGRAGVIRTISDNNNASDWVPSATGGPLQTIGTINPGLSSAGGNGCASNRVPDTVFVGGVPPYDVSVVTIVEPVTDFNLTSSEIVKIKIKNYGIQSVSYFPVSYVIGAGVPVTDTIYSTLQQGDTLVHVFSKDANLASFGIYNFKAYLTYPGDNTPLNDTAYASIENKMLIFCPSYATTPSSYEDIGNVTISNLNNGYPLPVLSNPTATNGYSDFTNLPPVLLAPGATYPMSISQISASSTTAASYINVYIDYNRDGIFDAISENAFGGITSSSSTTIAGNVYIPVTASQGITVMRVVLDRYTNAMPCGTYTYGETEDYLVMMAPLIPQDAGVLDILQPFSLYNSGSSVPVEVKVQNFGTNPINYLEIAYEVNGGPPVIQLYTSMIPPGAVFDIMLANHTILPGDNFICAYTILAGDSNTFNDSRCSLTFGAFVTTPPYSDNFDGAVNLWWTDSVPTQWERGEPDANIINYPYSPPNVWATDLDDIYESITYSYLYSPKFNVLSAVGVDSLFFRHFIHAQSGDGGNIQYLSTSGWRILGMPNDTNAINWYNSTQNIWTDMGAGPGYKLSAYNIKAINDFAAITQFRFVFAANNSANTNRDGWAIDNFRITTPKIPRDAGVISIIEPVSPIIKGDNIQVKIRVKNFGLDALDTIPIRYKINNQGSVNKTWTNWTLKPDSTFEYTFPLIVPPVNSFNLCAFTDVSNDSYLFNNSTCDSIEVIAPDKDAGLLSIEYPLQQTIYGMDTTIAVWIKNFGRDTIKSTEVEYTAGTIVGPTETWIGNLAPGDSMLYIFNSNFNHPYVGFFYFLVYTKLSGDGYMLNDTIKIILESYLSDVDENLLEGFSLEQNIPNPTTGRSIIYYSLPSQGEINFEVLNNLGQRFYHKRMSVSQGKHEIELDLGQLSSGIYYYYIEFEGKRIARKMVIVK